MSDVDKIEEKVFLNNQEISQSQLQEEMQKKNQRLIQEDDTHYRKLERMNE